MKEWTGFNYSLVDPPIGELLLSWEWTLSYTNLGNFLTNK